MNTCTRHNPNHSRRLAARLFAAGLLLAATSSALAAVRYVDLNNARPTPPYANWATAAAIIQDAIDVAVAGDEIVVTNGTYCNGARVVLGTTNRVVIDKPLTVRSVNGPGFTAIQGAQDGLGIRCVYLTNTATLSGFTLVGGTAVSTYSSDYGYGGGAYGGALNNCTLMGNSDSAASSRSLSNCTLTVNSGGAYLSTLTNCALSGNSGDGVSSSTLNNCSITGNSGRGAYRCIMNNCVVYFDAGVNYDSSCILNYCCTTPQPANGVGDISLDPQLASASHLSSASPCRGAGNAPYASGTDIDGEAWASPPSIGCDEYHAGQLTGPLSPGITASFTNAVTGFAMQLTGLVEGRAAAKSWDFGDGSMATNQPYTSHAWMAAGDYAVAFRAYNESLPAGVTATVTLHIVPQPIHYVAADNSNPVTPYTSWATAAINIQDAVVAATVAGALVLVTNGTYATGGRSVDGGLHGG